MKGIVLAGGTATRLYPLTIVTNKHLLPIYDRPMIYYPIETLAGMGIEEVLVIVGGKSVGDVVELLADGAHFGLDLTYRYQRGALGIAHAIGLARNFVRDDTFCCVLGDNVLRGPKLDGVAREFETGAWGAGTLLHRVADPHRFGVAELNAAGEVVGFEEKPEHPKSDLIPIGVYFLRPDVFDVIQRLAPSGRGEYAKLNGTNAISQNAIAPIPTAPATAAVRSTAVPRSEPSASRVPTVISVTSAAMLRVTVHPSHALSSSRPAERSVMTGG